MMKRIGFLVALVGALMLQALPAGAVAWVSPSGQATGPTNKIDYAQGVITNGGLNVVGSMYQQKIGTPAAPVLSTNGTAGLTSLVYACVAFDINGAGIIPNTAGDTGAGQSIPSATATITTANATLSATNSVNVTCGGAVGALGYLINKVDTAHVIGFCYSNSNSSCTFVDTGTYVNGNGGASQTSSFTYTANTIDRTGGNACSGSVKAVAGAVIVTAPCISGYTSCEALAQGGATPVAGQQANCSPTSTATVINSATVTVGAVQIYLAGTPSPSPVVNWWAGPY